MSKKISRVGVDAVPNGGVIISPPVYNVYANKYRIAVKGQLIASHYPCGQPGGSAHCHSVVTIASNKVFVNKIGVARKGDLTSCLHSIISGSETVFSN